MADKKVMACPFCGEEILTVAKKCKHCGEFLEKKEEKKPEHFYKCYGKTANYKYGTIALWLIVWVILWIVGTNGDSLIPHILAIACLVPIFQVLSKRIHLEDDQVVIEKGLFIKKYKYIPYKQINDVELKSLTNTLIFYTGNDKPIKFTWAEKPKEILDFIQDRANR